MDASRASLLDAGGGPVALLLHGQPGRAGHWAPVARLVRRQMRVLAFDRPGYGRNAEQAGGFSRTAEAAAELLAALEVRRAVVVGHSWGGGAALAMASRFPELVAALVLVGSVVPRAKPTPADQIFAGRLIGPPAARIGMAMGGLGLSALARRQAGVTGLSPDELAATASEWRGGRAWRSFYAEQRALVDELPALAGELGAIRTPTTILSGRRDPVSPPSRVRALAGALPNATLLPPAPGGHLLPLRRPALVAAAIEAAARSGGLDPGPTR